jgi:hypothetical protein
VTSASPTETMPTDDKSAPGQDERGSTTRGVRTSKRNRPGVAGRRIALSLMALAVLVGATGFLGVKARTLRSSAFGYTMTLTYPQIARPGLDIPWRLTLHHAGGFDQKQNITVAVSNRYWDIFEFQGLHPEPSDETADSDFVYLTFEPPPPGSDAFSVSLDTYVQPASQIGRHAVTAVIIGGQRVTQVSYTTWLVP